MAQIKISELEEATTVVSNTVVLVVNEGETQTTSLETIKNVLLEDVNAQLGDVENILATLVTVDEEI
jgi:hypothetical protein